MKSTLAAITVTATTALSAVLCAGRAEAYTPPFTTSSPLVAAQPWVRGPVLVGLPDPDDNALPKIEGSLGSLWWSKVNPEPWTQTAAGFDLDADDELLLPCGPFLDGEPQLALLGDPWRGAPDVTIVRQRHIDKEGNLVDYDQIPRRWDRPDDYEAYRYPVERHVGWPAVLSGYDLDLPDSEQRRGSMRAVGHGGVDLPQEIGAPITMVPLANQIGDARVVFVGTLFGNTVVTLHDVREGGGHAHYLLVFGHLDSFAKNLHPGQTLGAQAPVGAVGNSDSPELVHLHLEVRRLRDRVDARTFTADRVLARDATIVTDPRNVLQLRPGARISSSCRERVRQAKRGELSRAWGLALDLPTLEPIWRWRH